MSFRVVTVRKPAPGIVMVNGRIWTRAKLRGRTKNCEQCRVSLPSGSIAYRPLVEGDGIVRYMRLCLRCLGVGGND